ncbi:copper transporter [Ornithinimicrobium avium]|uniref:Copper transporter n=1 Tax=Ornithinimicrobium avium TaxID=2283195 RepID=A0A345NJ56_9MICO|nr:copper transporter [Ornithinimicrobium avium]AXH95064.1 copper transporter [Ornithinimicrobium avium]
MIDFRYHVVSLVAVFIALAVGIALGAGPLREGLSSTLESEVSQLREERTTLREQVDAADARAAAREQAFGRVSGRALEGTLSGVRVGVVALPGADRNTIDALEERLSTAGADLALSVEIADSWADAEPDASRSETLRSVQDLVRVPEPREGADPDVATALAAVLAGADQPGDLGAWRQAATLLEDEGLVDLTWRDATSDSFTDRRPPDTFVVVSGGLDAADAEEPAGEQALAARLDLVEGLAELDVPTVVAGQGTEKAPVEGEDHLDPLVGAVRDDRGLAQEVSTVDNLEHITGQVATAMALAWALDGVVGHYGLGRLADSSLPQVPPVRTVSVGVPVPDGGTDEGGAEEGSTGRKDGRTSGDPADPGTAEDGSGVGEVPGTDVAQEGGGLGELLPDPAGTTSAP